MQFWSPHQRRDFVSRVAARRWIVSRKKAALFAPPGQFGSACQRTWPLPNDGSSTRPETIHQINNLIRVGDTGFCSFGTICLELERVAELHQSAKAARVTTSKGVEARTRLVSTFRDTKAPICESCRKSSAARTRGRLWRRLRTGEATNFAILFFPLWSRES